MTNAFNKHHDPPVCPECRRIAVAVQVSRAVRMCLPCLREKRREAYDRIYKWAVNHPPMQRQRTPMPVAAQHAEPGGKGPEARP